MRPLKTNAIQKRQLRFERIQMKRVQCNHCKKAVQLVSVYDEAQHHLHDPNNPIHSGTYRATYTPAYRIESPLNDKGFIQSCMEDNLKYGEYDPKDIQQFQEIISGKYNRKLKTRLKRAKYSIRSFIRKYIYKIRLFFRKF